MATKYPLILDGTTIKELQSGDTLADVVQTSDIGSTVQAYDADTAKTDTAQTYTAPQGG